MSFDQDIRASGDFRALLQRLKRRIAKTELSRDDKEQLQSHVNSIRTQIDFMNSIDTIDNLLINPTGPHDFIFEPDKTEVMMYNNFSRQFGDGLKSVKLIGGSSYNVIEIGDDGYILSTASNGTYHYNPYQTFDGIDDYVEQADSASLDLLQFSVACWFNTTSSYGSSDAMLVNKGGHGSDTTGENMNYGLFFNSDDDNQITAGFEETDGSNHYVVSPLTYNDGLWHHACVTYDQVTIRLYIDGTQVNTHATTTTPETNSQPLRIGANSRNLTRFFNGFIDEVFVWNNDLTAGEVSALWNLGVVPQEGAIVYSNSFGGFGSILQPKKCYYSGGISTNNEQFWDWTFPPIGAYQSIKYDGVNDFIQLGNDTSLWSSSWKKMSFSMWIYTDAAPASRKTIVSHGSSGYFDLYTTTSGGNDIEADIFAIEDTTAVFTNYPHGGWNHVAVVYDLTLVSDNVKIYVNGVLGTPATGNIGQTYNDPSNLTIGRTNGGIEPFLGKTRDFKMWLNQALTATEINLVMNDSPLSPTPSFWLPMSEATGNPKDRISGTKVGTLTNGASWDIISKAFTTGGGSVSLNVGISAHQFIYYDDFGTDFDFTGNNLSFGFWIYATSLADTGSNRTVFTRRIDANNDIKIEIDNTDNKLFGELRIAGTASKRQYDVPLREKTWYYISGTCSFTGPVLSLKVNDNADTSSTKSLGSSAPDDKVYFGGYGGQLSARDFEGYLVMPMLYKHSTVLTTAERTSLFNYNTRTDTTKPIIWGVAQFG